MHPHRKCGPFATMQNTSKLIICVSKDTQLAFLFLGPVTSPRNMKGVNYEKTEDVLCTNNLLACRTCSRIHSRRGRRVVPKRDATTKPQPCVSCSPTRRSSNYFVCQCNYGARMPLLLSGKKNTSRTQGKLCKEIWL